MNISELKEFVIVVTSDEPYSKMWHTQLVYTEFLSKTNTVFYINPPKKWTLKNIFNRTLKADSINKNLTVLNYINRLPVFLKVFNSFNERYNEYKVSGQLKETGKHKVLIWHFDSYRNSFSGNFFNRSFLIKRIYHVIDPFNKNPIDRQLRKISNTLVITSPRINSFYLDCADKILNIPQCLDIVLQKKMVNGPCLSMNKFNSGYFVLLGTISDDVDFDWLLNLLNNEKFKLVIIGKITNVILNRDKCELLFNHHQVDYLGLLSPLEFYPVLKNASAGLIIYNEEKVKKPSSTLKVLNYLISELPVITNIECEIPILLDNSIFMCNSIESCNNFVSLALNKALVFDREAVNNYLNSVSMSEAVEKIISKI
jgi:hypothetical protein